MGRNPPLQVSRWKYFPVVGLTLVLLACGIVTFRQSTILGSLEVIDGLNEPEAASEVVQDPSENSIPFADDMAFRDELSLVKDRTLELRPQEMGAYWRLMREQRKRSYEDLRKQARSSQSLASYFQDPDSVRGALVSHSMTVRRVLTYKAAFEKGEEPTTIYEIWGSTERAKNWLFVLVASELPAGFNEKTILKKRVTMVGYFMKLQGYHPAAGKSSDRPLAAPLILGKLKPIDVRQPATSTGTISPVFILAGLGGLCMALLGTFYFVYRAQNKALQVGDRPVLDQELNWIADADPSQPDSESE